MSGRTRILVIDDDPLFRSLIVSLLRKDYFVSVASEGSEGYYKALEYPPDIAVIDIQMPGWDGLKTLSEFRKHPALANVKTVILTSDASKETVLAAIQGGANDYVIKTSFSRTEFTEKLEKLRQLVQNENDVDSETVLPNSNSHQSEAPVASSVESEAETAVEATVATATQIEENSQDIQEIMDAWE